MADTTLDIDSAGIEFMGTSFVMSPPVRHYNATLTYGAARVWYCGGIIANYKEGDDKTLAEMTIRKSCRYAAVLMPQ